MRLVHTNSQYIGCECPCRGTRVKHPPGAHNKDGDCVFQLPLTNQTLLQRADRGTGDRQNGNRGLITHGWMRMPGFTC